MARGTAIYTGCGNLGGLRTLAGLADPLGGSYSLNVAYRQSSCPRYRYSL